MNRLVRQFDTEVQQPDRGVVPHVDLPVEDLRRGQAVKVQRRHALDVERDRDGAHHQRQATHLRTTPLLTFSYSAFVSVESDALKSVRLSTKSLIPAPEPLAVYSKDCPGQACSNALTKSAIAFFCAVEPLAFRADLPPQVTLTGGAGVAAGLPPPALLRPPQADRIRAQLARILSAAPNLLSFNPIPFTDEIIAAGIASARRTPAFVAGMTHRNKIRTVAIMPGCRRFCRARDFSLSFPLVHVRDGRRSRVRASPAGTVHAILTPAPGSLGADCLTWNTNGRQSVDAQ